ncbi:MAG TPA: ROK family protein [Prolixibacteraceae bacterium]|nr:ROK family protein [Prolixibacteraceae bacterium]
MKKEIIVGVDIGGTSIGAGCIIDKKIEKIYSKPTGANRSADEIFETLCEVIENVLLPGTLALGVGVPGLLNAQKGEILNIYNIPVWKNFPLKQKLEERFKIPAHIDNDANCFALGEKHFGKGQQYKNLVALTLGTGVGGGMIINDKIHSGMFGGAGEVGCWPYKDESFEDYCGSGFFIKKNKITGQELFEKAKSGDQQAQKIFDEFGIHVGKLIKNILYILAPEAIIIGGSISKSFSFFEAAIRNELSDFPFKVMIENIAIEKSELKDIAILGAAGLYYN